MDNPDLECREILVSQYLVTSLKSRVVYMHVLSEMPLLEHLAEKHAIKILFHLQTGQFNRFNDYIFVKIYKIMH